MKRNSRQRDLIFQTLQEHCDHPSAEELYTELRQLLPSISLGTVYRNLDQLSSAGRIHKIHAAGTVARFDPDLEPHPHFCCSDCGRVYDLPAECTITELINCPLLESAGYTVQNVALEIRGVCQNCRDKKQVV